MHEAPTASMGLACDLSAIAPEQRAAHQALASELIRQAAHERVELPDGYAFRFAAERYTDVTTFIANERLCCPFFMFRLEVMPQQGWIWLHISGGEGVKTLLQDELLGE